MAKSRTNRRRVCVSSFSLFKNRLSPLLFVFVCMVVSHFTFLQLCMCMYCCHGSRTCPPPLFGNNHTHTSPLLLLLLLLWKKNLFYSSRTCVLCCCVMQVLSFLSSLSVCLSVCVCVLCFSHFPYLLYRCVTMKRDSSRLLVSLLILFFVCLTHGVFVVYCAFILLILLLFSLSFSLFLSLFSFFFFCLLFSFLSLLSLSLSSLLPTPISLLGGSQPDPVL